MKIYVLFGAGKYAIKAIHLLGKEKIEFILDNDPSKWGGQLGEIYIYSPEEKKDILKSYQVVISVSPKYQREIVMQLMKMNIKNIKTLEQIQIEITRRKINDRKDYLKLYNKAIEWTMRNTLNGQAVICNTNKKTGYPEVTGYFIPTLLQWGYSELALSYAQWLCNIQKEDGSWYDVDNAAPYVFDTGQILKGLLAIRKIYPDADPHIIKGCDWILHNMQQSGRLVTPTIKAWGNKNVCSELIHLYCLSPLIEAGEIYNRPIYKSSAYKILDYYKSYYYSEIKNFNILSHFYGYIMEALLDLGEDKIVREAMVKIEKLQRVNGAVPAYQNVDWVCSVGLFQLAIVWFRLGDIEHGEKAFVYACKLQNESGGWYGSYLSEENPNENNDYFPSSEISWSVKYFLDALYYRNIAEFNLCSSSFPEFINRSDGRYRIVRQSILAESVLRHKSLTILDAGCGKGRYLKNLIKDEPGHRYFAFDLSKKILEYIKEEGICKEQGILTNIPYPDHCFDITYTCEALEHAIDIKNAVKELARVTKPGGKILIIDKNKAELGRLEIGEWEVWFDAEQLKGLMEIYCSTVTVIPSVDYEGVKNDNLFLAWIGIVKEEDTYEDNCNIWYTS